MTDVFHWLIGHNKKQIFFCYFAENINKNTEQLGILVCTDEVFRDLDIRNAQHTIHFSLPGNWTLFNQRFRASFDYYLKFSEDVSAAICFIPCDLSLQKL